MFNLIPSWARDETPFFVNEAEHNKTKVKTRDNILFVEQYYGLKVMFFLDFHFHQIKLSTKILIIINFNWGHFTCIHNLFGIFPGIII